MTNLNKKALVVLLRERLGKDAVIDPTDLETNKNDYQIKKKRLLTLFKSNNKFIDSVIEKANKKWTDTIYLNEFINFLRYEATTLNNTKYTQGTYHIYMDYIHVLYDIKCDNFNDLNNDQMGLPNYINIIKDKQLYNAIFPKRKEFIFAWWIMNIVRKTYSKYINIDVEFQTKIEGKIFDIYIKSCDLVIEYQEAKANHTDIDTDKDKKAIIRGQGMVIEYFQERIYKENPDEYLYDFWTNKLEKRIIQALLKNNEIFLEYYIFNRFKEEYKELKENLKKRKKEGSYIKDRIYQIDSLLIADNENIKKIFSWKDSTKNGKDDKIISVNDIANLLKITSTKQKKIIKNTLIELVVGYNKKGEIYTDWNGLITFLLMIDDDLIKIDPIIKRIVIDYLLSIQTIYENIMNEIELFNKNLINNIIDNSQRRETYIKNTIENKYIKNISSLTKNNSDQKVIISDFDKQLKNTLKISKKIVDINNNITNELENIKKDLINIKNTKKIITNISRTLEQFDGYKKDINTYYDNMNIIKSKENFVLSDNLIIDEPIIVNIPEITYTGNFKDSIPVIKIESFFKRREIPNNIIKLLINRLSQYADNPKTLYKLKLKDHILEENEIDEDNTDEDVTDEDNTDEDVTDEDITDKDITDKYVTNKNDDSDLSDYDTLNI